MKRIYIKQLTAIISMVVTFNLFTAATYANDGVTPAEETTCDVLTADGVTKGLYGLCVAYCEAQDIFDETQPVTEAEILVTLEDRKPNERILANYNKRKTESDPEMPCIVPVANAACPCWDTLESFDGSHDIGGVYSPMFFAERTEQYLVLAEMSWIPRYESFAAVSTDGPVEQPTFSCVSSYKPDGYFKHIIGIDGTEYQTCLQQLEDVIYIYGVDVYFKP